MTITITLSFILLSSCINVSEGTIPHNCVSSVTMSVFQSARRLFSRKEKSGQMGNANGVKTVCGETNVETKYSSSTSASASSSSMINVKCRNDIYPQSGDLKRVSVPDSAVPWSISMPKYAPVEYTAPSVTSGPVWADPDISSAVKMRWNAKDDKINRKSYEKDYEIIGGRPINPIGRTGISGRGLLGKWGPNHAADPIVTRWKLDSKGNPMKHGKSNKPILQFVSIQRKDSKEWAIPGGMVDDNEEVSLTLKREFGEEAMNSIEMTDSEKHELEAELKDFFNAGHEIFKGYVDDPRNTDNAWMETVAMNFHDNSGKRVGRFPLAAGDDAGDVKWVDVDAALKLYASHANMIEKTARRHDAHWN